MGICQFCLRRLHGVLVLLFESLDLLLMFCRLNS